LPIEKLLKVFVSIAALDAFEQAIAIDSAFAPAYYHAVQLRAMLKGEESARVLASKYARAVYPASDELGDPGRRAAMSVVAELLARPDSPANCREEAPFDVLYTTIDLLRRLPDRREIALRCLEMIAERDRAAWDADRNGVRQIAAGELLLRGHLHKALSTNLSAVYSTPQSFHYLALAGAIPKRTADSIYATWARGTDGLRSMFAITWYRRTNQSDSIRAIDRRLTQVVRRAGDPETEMRAYASHVARAALALVARDTTRAIMILEAAHDSVCGWRCTPDRFLLPILLANRADQRKYDVDRARQELTRWPLPPDGLLDVAGDPFWHLAQAAIAERHGDSHIANMEYNIVVRALAQADSELARCVAFAKAGADRTARTITRAYTAPLIPDLSVLACSTD